MPDCVIDLGNAWGHKYQKEEEQNKIEFLNRKTLKFDWDNDKLDQLEHLIVDSEHVGVFA